ncbi:MAG: hypothetical protein IKE38_02570 [Erysipelotrichaceae bacterium]|nr:hypothetical protein [Erysipelotrichaceae bacterium]
MPLNVLSKEGSQQPLNLDLLLKLFGLSVLLAQNTIKELYEKEDHLSLKNASASSGPDYLNKKTG